MYVVFKDGGLWKTFASKADAKAYLASVKSTTGLQVGDLDTEGVISAAEDFLNNNNTETQ